MFTQLPESGSRKSKQERWLSASTGLHLLVIAGAVTLTPQREATSVEPPETVHLVYVNEPRPTQPTFQSSPSHSSTQSGSRLRFPTVRDLRDIAGVMLPDIDVQQDDGGTANDFRALSGDCGLRVPIPQLSGAPLSVDQVDKPALALPGNATPTYPELLRSAGVEGSVTLRFVIDTTGAVERGSVSVVRSDHELFASAVRAALSKHHFMPAEAAGRKVRMLVEQRFDFEIAQR